MPLSWVDDLLELNRGKHAERGVAARRLWKISVYSKIALASSTRVRHRWRSRSSTCIWLQNDSMTALSKQSPTEPIDGRRPESIARRVNAQEVNCVPWSEWITVPSGRRC